MFLFAASARRRTNAICRVGPRLYVSLLAERTKTPAGGLFGGEDGMLPRFEMENGTPLDPKGIHVVGVGEALIVRSHGGGYGDPSMREPALSEQDIVSGLAAPRP